MLAVYFFYQFVCFAFAYSFSIVKSLDCDTAEEVVTVCETIVGGLYGCTDMSSADPRLVPVELGQSFQ